ncbi:MAG: beta-ketoacyl-[acyl-carrier-protein] synthase family protein [Bacteroidetes bacterium]|nr:beta-ketoacyl-[acyl-carrier-protein] synthase family protein [Bacteroidota bacterium]
MPQRIFITGYGIISCIGNNIEETLSSLLGSKPGTGRIRYVETLLKDELLVGEVPKTLAELFVMAGISPVDGYSRNALLGMIAAREAFEHGRLDDHRELKTGLISATTVGGMDRSEFYYNDFLTNDTRNVFIDSYDCADSTEKIAQLLEITGFVTTISTACSSAANAIMLGARMIRSGRLDRVLAGGSESLTKFHLNGFNALKILDKEPCKPFDQHRAGINLGEGAAYLVLESEESLAKTGNVPFAELVGWGNACEAYHQTASSPDGIGAYLAMKEAIDMSGLAPGDIDYVNAHGTGTDNNDLSEGHAIERLFVDKMPMVSSTKQFTGHTTSAAGSIEAILSVLCLQNQVIWPNLNFKERIAELNFSPVEKLMINVAVNAVMSNSFGFGGNDTSLIFKKVNASNENNASNAINENNVCNAGNTGKARGE